MKAVITADIINSTKSSSNSWIVELKKTLKNFGKEGANWEIFRGDEFQILIENPLESFHTAIVIKASLVANNMDARIAIGFGEIDYLAKKIKESNGTAFINSGRTLELLKNSKNKTLAIKSELESLNENFDVILELLQAIFSNWTASSAKALLEFLQNPTLNQNQLAEKLNISQSAFSQFLKKANLDAILTIDEYFRKKIAEIS